MLDLAWGRHELVRWCLRQRSCQYEANSLQCCSSPIFLTTILLIIGLWAYLQHYYYYNYFLLLFSIIIIGLWALSLAVGCAKGMECSMVCQRHGVLSFGNAILLPYLQLPLQMLHVSLLIQVCLNLHSQGFAFLNLHQWITLFSNTHNAI